MVQEMGRCDRGRQNDNNIVTDDFHLLLSCKDFVYLNQRLYQPQPSLPSVQAQPKPSLPSVKAIMTVADEIQMQRENLLDLLKMIVLKGDCWHKQIEDILCNPCEPPLMNNDQCTNGCPSCLETMSDYIMYSG